MKRIKFLLSVGVVAMIAASPLLAQTVETGDAEKKAKVQTKQQEEVLKLREQLGNVKVRQEQAYANALKPGASNGVSVQPQVTLANPFWRNPEFVKTANLTADQQKKMEDVFQQHRLKLIDLNGSLAKEESVLSSLMEDLRADEETRVLNQIDRVAQARAELEKANARMLLGLRQVLTPEQWSKLSAATPLPNVKKAYRFTVGEKF